MAADLQFHSGSKVIFISTSDNNIDIPVACTGLCCRFHLTRAVMEKYMHIGPSQARLCMDPKLLNQKFKIA